MTEYIITDSNASYQANAAPTLKLDSRSRLLQSAITIFAKYGFAGASLRQITDQAGLNHGSVKYHYKTKEKLWQASISYLYAELEKAPFISDALWEQMQMREKLEHITRSFIRYCARHPELFRIIMFETMHESPRLDWIVENFTKPYADKSLKRILKAKNSKIFREDVDDMNLHYILLSASRTIFLLAPEVERVFGIDVFSDEQVRKHEAAVVKLMLDQMPIPRSSED